MNDLVIFFVIVSFILCVWCLLFFIDKIKHRNWLEISGKIVKSSITECELSRGSRGWTIELIVEYSYENTIYRIEDPFSMKFGSSNKKSMQKRLEELNKKSYVCIKVNPNSPEEAVMVE